MTGGQLTMGAKDRGAKDRGAKDRGANDRGANDRNPLFTSILLLDVSMSCNLYHGVHFNPFVCILFYFIMSPLSLSTYYVVHP